MDETRIKGDTLPRTYGWYLVGQKIEKLAPDPSPVPRFSCMVAVSFLYGILDVPVVETSPAHSGDCFLLFCTSLICSMNVYQPGLPLDRQRSIVGLCLTVRPRTRQRVSSSWV